MRVIMLDNHDSFAYNLVDLFTTLGHEVDVYRNSAPAETFKRALEPTDAERAVGIRPLLCLSPGPGHPRTSGCLMEMVRWAIESDVPTLGICLGFQAMVEACGGTVDRVPAIHGKTWTVNLTNDGVKHPGFAHLVDARRESDTALTIDVARYHSLGTRELPSDLVALASTSESIVMAAAHRTSPMVGVQFHPESILTPQGPSMMNALIAYLTRQPQASESAVVTADSTHPCESHSNSAHTPASETPMASEFFASPNVSDHRPSHFSLGRHS
ncbi:glutamine amidotransferase-related protein [Actinomyces vulturis]|uniref:glutamine amidotransferase-related protein n=1 Tax=Actinomyces vulturis TaxID=1857645 RepID=UPI00082981A8